MTGIPHTIAVLLALAAGTGALAPLGAQGIPTGSTVVAGSPDSLFTQFVDFLKGKGDSATSTDSRRRTVEAKIAGVDERVIFRFVGRGDSTSITAQGIKGGMTALIMGLGVINDWLKARPASKPDAPPRTEG